LARENLVAAAAAVRATLRGVLAADVV